MAIKFDNDPLDAVQNNYLTNVANTYIVYDLGVWPVNTINNFKFKNCLYDKTSIAKNSDKEKWVYSGYGKCKWSFGNDYAKNVIIAGVDKNSSSHADNHKKNFSWLSVGNFLLEFALQW